MSNISDTPKKVKNPLFSANVTGFTVDDLTQNAVLMPAPTQPMTSKEDTQSVHNKPASSSEIFSEVSLDTDIQEKNQSVAYSTTQDASPLQDLECTAQQTSTAAQNPLTAPFSQLPSVASSVFSSFSNILGRTSSAVAPVPKPQEEYRSSLDSLLATNYDNSYQESAAPIPLISANPGSISAPTSFIPTKPTAVPPTGPVNTFRLGGQKKKTYAQVPGLCSKPLTETSVLSDIPTSLSSLSPVSLPPQTFSPNIPVAQTPSIVQSVPVNLANTTHLNTAPPIITDASQSYPLNSQYNDFQIKDPQRVDIIPTCNPQNFNLNPVVVPTAPPVSAFSTNKPPTPVNKVDSFQPIPLLPEPPSIPPTTIPPTSFPPSNCFISNPVSLVNTAVPSYQNPTTEQTVPLSVYSPTSAFSHTNSSQSQNLVFGSPQLPISKSIDSETVQNFTSFSPIPLFDLESLPKNRVTTCPPKRVYPNYINKPSDNFSTQTLFATHPPPAATVEPISSINQEPNFPNIPPKPANFVKTLSNELFTTSTNSPQLPNNSETSTLSSTSEPIVFTPPANFVQQQSSAEFLYQIPTDLPKNYINTTSNLDFSVPSGASSLISTTPVLNSRPSSVSDTPQETQKNNIIKSCSASEQQILCPVEQLRENTPPTNTTRLGADSSKTNNQVDVDSAILGQSVSEPNNRKPDNPFNSYFQTQEQPKPSFYNPNDYKELVSTNNLRSAEPNLSLNQPLISDFQSKVQSTQDLFKQATDFSSTSSAPATYPISSITMANSGVAVNQNNYEITNSMSIQNDGSSATNTEAMVYRPVYQHWFYKKEVEGKAVWQPFSMLDSLSLEGACTSEGPDALVATDGGRYDVSVTERTRTPVFWTGDANEVRRCSWFYKGVDSRYIPYEEAEACRLEEEFKIAVESNEWHRRVALPNGETVVFHGPQVIVHFLQAQSPDAWGNTPATANRPRVVKRGVDEFHIEEGEPETVDHVLFLVHGIGSVCDLKFRSVQEVVDEFRSTSLQLIQSHYKTACERGEANRIEVLPVSWHASLHSDETGIDKQLKAITLESIPKLRHFTNDTLLDILFYTSPVYCDNIMQTVGTEINRIYTLFKTRNPAFNGGVSLGGHSLGSLILFDLLCHQKPQKCPDNSNENTDNAHDSEREETQEHDSVSPLKTRKPLRRTLSRRISYVMAHAGTGQPCINYPQLSFQPNTFFALGSPIGMFVTVRGLDALGSDFKLPTCPGFFNIFHPYDPVAYRVEALINTEMGKLRPVLIPHHKGRKRMHLELKETMARVGADLKQRLLDSVKSTWNSVYHLALFKGQGSLEEEVDKVLEHQLALETNGMGRSRLDSASDTENTEVPADRNVPMGNLNAGRRIDYVLQEAPLEFFNEYLFALTSHVCYWESEDTILLILKEIYTSRGIRTDGQIPQQTMTIERTVSNASSVRSTPSVDSASGMDPSARTSSSITVGPPPTHDFKRAS